MNATFIATHGAGTEVRYSAGARNRGGGSRDAAINNYRISLHNDQTCARHPRPEPERESRWRKSPASAVMRRAGVTSQDVLRRSSASTTPISPRPRNSTCSGRIRSLRARTATRRQNHFPADPQGQLLPRRRCPRNLANLSYWKPIRRCITRSTPSRRTPKPNYYSDLIDLIRRRRDANLGRELRQPHQPGSTSPRGSAYSPQQPDRQRETSIGTASGRLLTLQRRQRHALPVDPHDLDTNPVAATPPRSRTRRSSAPADVASVSRLLKNAAFLPTPVLAQLRGTWPPHLLRREHQAALDNDVKGTSPSRDRSMKDVRRKRG